MWSDFQESEGKWVRKQKRASDKTEYSLVHFALDSFAGLKIALFRLNRYLDSARKNLQDSIAHRFRKTQCSTDVELITQT